MLCLLLLVYFLSSAACSELLGRHKRSWIIASFTVEEAASGPFPYELGEIDIKPDLRVSYDLHGQGVNLEPVGVFSILKHNATIYVHQALDYEKHQRLELTFETSRRDLTVETKLAVEIIITDINDNPPRFPTDLYEITIPESNRQGSHLLQVKATDIDKKDTLNSTFHYEIKSVSPKTPNVEFFIEESGNISFKGCLDHTVADMFKILVEAKDHGEVVSLSSSTTVIVHVQDGNDHAPKITGQTGSGKVKEDESGVSPLRLHVTDGDTPHSPAWKAKYTIQGDEAGHFMITTDPDSNDGILTVVKPLDFEETAQVELSISVENELPYFLCKVREKTSTGLWKVDAASGDGRPHAIKVIIQVEDVNDPPVFTVTDKKVKMMENSPIGTWVEKVTAVDPDTTFARGFVYKMGNDSAAWLRVDPRTGDITTVKLLDRESHHVVNNVYTALLHAVENEEPRLTGTATLHIEISDQNDNVPQPEKNDLDMCISDGPSTTSIKASDLDENPFGGPFRFELLGDVEGKWRLSLTHGYTTGLIMEPGVYSGPHVVGLKISDLQGKFGVYNLSVTVCHCSLTANCQSRQHSGNRVASSAIVVVFMSLILLMSSLLLAVFCTCKQNFVTLETESSGQVLIKSNSEEPGTDCMVVDGSARVPSQNKHGWRPTTDVKQSQFGQHFTQEQYRRENQGYSRNDVNQTTRNSVKSNWSYARTSTFNQTTKNSIISNRFHHINQAKDMGAMNFWNISNKLFTTSCIYLQSKILTLQKTEGERLDDVPHVYAYEGEPDTLSELDAITFSDTESEKHLKI